MNLNIDDIGLIVLTLIAIIFLIYFMYTHKDEDLYDGQSMDDFKHSLNREFDSTFDSINIHDETVED